MKIPKIALHFCKCVRFSFVLIIILTIAGSFATVEIRRFIYDTEIKTLPGAEDFAIENSDTCPDECHRFCFVSDTCIASTLDKGGMNCTLFHTQYIKTAEKTGCKSSLKGTC